MKALLRILASFTMLLLALGCENAGNRGYWDDSSIGVASFHGVVKDSFGNPLEDVDICFRGTDTKRELRYVTFSDWDGSFSIEGVPSNARYVTFVLEGYATLAYTIATPRFAEGESIELNPVMEYSNASIRGKVLSAVDSQPLAGVRVDCGAAATTTLEDGSFAIEGLTLKDYTVVYTIADGSRYTREVAFADFIDGVAELPTVKLGGGDILPGMRWQELADAPVWYANNYHGSTGFTGINHWSVGYMSAFPWYGDYRYEAEGYALVYIAEEEKDKDPEEFSSFTYGRKRIEEGNHIMNVSLRTHYATAASPALFGVKVLDLSSGKPEAKDMGRSTYANSEYSSFHFDLSEFIGKDVVIAFGIYPTGENFHVASRRISFSSEPLNGDDALSGVKVSGAAWRGFTKENLSSLTPNEGRVFTGDSFGLDSSDGDGGARRVHNPGGEQGFSRWAGTNHLAMSWAFQYVNNVVEPVNPEGFTLKTRANAAPDYSEPENYIYGRFHIDASSKILHLFVRTFSSAAPTAFRVTAVSLPDFASTALAPVKNNAVSASAAENGCWNFIHEKGDDDPAVFAEFVYDLSRYEGSDVVLAIGVHKGATWAGEQKLCIRKIELAGV